MSFTASQLHVVTCVTNPVRFKSRYALYRKFRSHMHAAGVHLVTVEGAFGDRAFQVTSGHNEDEVRVRIHDELWHKENLLNIGISRLPHDWKYVAWVDADVSFDEPDWAAETIHALQHYSVVQMFRDAIDTGPNGEIVRDTKGQPVVWQSFGSVYADKGIVPNKPYSNMFGHPGYAWAARREAIDAVGGLMDRAILGAADHHMALALVGSVRASVPRGGLSKDYYRMLDVWQERAERHIRRNVGYVPLTLKHGWHGKKKDRKYVERWDLLRQWNYSPADDLVNDSHGVLRFTHQGQRMRDDFRRYFRQRAEDSLDVE